MHLRLLLISIMSCLLLIVVNEYNLDQLDVKENNGQLLYTADQPSYFAPPINFKEIGHWKDNSVGYSSYYQRPPGYGFLFFVAHSFSQSHAYLILKIIQILLFGCSVYLFGRTLKSLKIKQKIVLVGTFLYGVLPFFSTFTYFALTESILPFSVILILYLALQFNQKQTIKTLFVLGLWVGLALLVRPQLAFLVIPTLFFLLRNFKRSKLQTFLFSALISIPFLSWNIRNYSVNQEWVGLHPIYHYSNNHMYRPIHQNMSDLFRIWESNAASFHKNMAVLFKDTTQESRLKVMQTIPKNITEKYEVELLKNFKSYQQASFELRKQFKRNTYLKEKDIESEIYAIPEIKLLTSKIKSNFWFTNHILTPLSALKEFIGSSHLGLFIYQSSFRGNPLMEIARWLSFLFLFTILLLSVSTLFITQLNSTVRLTIASALLYVFYLIYFQRMNEERYYYILFPVFFVGSITLLTHFLQRKTAT